MSAEYFDMFKILLQVLIFVSFILIFLYLVYCEGRETSKTRSLKGAGEGKTGIKSTQAKR